MLCPTVRFVFFDIHRIIVTRHLADKAITTPKVKPTYYYVTGDNGGSRQSLSGTSWASVIGASQSYTSGNTTEVLLITGTALIQASAAGSIASILVGGSPVGRGDYADTALAGNFVARSAPPVLYNIAANTTVTISLGIKLASGTGSVANASADQTNLYTPSLSIIAFAR